MGDRFIKGFYDFLRPTLGLWLKKTYRIQAEYSEIKKIDPPYIVVSNHCLNWDPFMVAIYIPKAVRYIASDNLFRNPLLAYMMTHWVGAVSKKKAVADSKTVKDAIKILKRGGVIGVFPEANRTWDGKTIQSIYATAKLIKLAKVPIVSCQIRGGYLSRPRWAVKGRKGIMELAYSVLIDSEQIKKMSVEEIYQKLNQGISYNEFEWQKKHMHHYASKTPAEFLELYLYICPKCKSIGKLRSCKNEFKCTVCQTTHVMGNYGFFKGKRMFEQPQAWGGWQKQQLEKLIEQNGEIFKDQSVSLHGSTNRNKLVKTNQGSMTLYQDRIEFDSVIPKEKLVFPILKIMGNTIQYNYIFEFYCEGVFRRFLFSPKERISAFKWNQAVECIKRKGEQDERRMGMGH